MRKEGIWERENLINLYEIWEKPEANKLDVGLRVLVNSFIVIGEKSLGLREGESRKSNK